MNHPTQTALGFDFGTGRIGLASGQTLTATATPLATLAARDGIPDWTALDAVLREWTPDLLVVGIPLNMDGSISEMARRARKFANRIQDRYRLPCYLMDERLSTQEAKQIHFAQGGSHHFSKDPVDSLAAQLILESWFNSSARIPSHTPLETLYDIGQSES
ncbi:Holliday junction resolvase RuvX [Nitrincola tapanii]|uniref:Putative pre-16S rRNA nuclease n=1 Tax=Nitrincola tapanii TaxID=1708751 RepID=A0A5A9W1A1_9GAMM|nr:Holliday junction resolvase RuvX [Nitrincola tapanii]KAA0874333.1 Holliday junction resolvase RuvX [Nitrincola tapanii]